MCRFCAHGSNSLTLLPATDRAMLLATGDPTLVAGTILKTSMGAPRLARDLDVKLVLAEVPPLQCCGTCCDC